MKTNHAEITIVLDRSGSMSSVREDTIGGFNTFLEAQRKVPGSATLTLHQFDHEFVTSIKAQDIQTAPKLTTRTFMPRGNTALLDAIGRAIVDTGARLEAVPEGERPAKVIFVIITDGHENASQEYSAVRVAEMIKHQKESYSWEFVFLGANQDAIASAAKVGIPAANAMSYAANANGVAATYRSLSTNLAEVRCCSSGVSSMAFTDEDRKKQREAGAPQ